jgi:hypothetical protein
MTKTIGLRWLQQVTKHVPATDEASVHRAQPRVNLSIAPESLTELAIFLSVMSKSQLLSVARLSSFLPNSERRKKGVPARTKRYWRERMGRTP